MQDVDRLRAEVRRQRAQVEALKIINAALRQVSEQTRADLRKARKRHR